MQVRTTDTLVIYAKFGTPKILKSLYLCTAHLIVIPQRSGLLRLKAGALGLIEFLKQFSSRLVDLC